ncbi:MAG: hypothetical protein LBD03_01350 [Methanobrevibacter sp.]|jgi:hypothetical protein|nr:hypothetical protein [Candidatus Methanovirga procula]
MKNEMKGLFVIGLILTSIVGSSFAFNMQNMSNNQSSYFDGVLADSKNFEYICPSKTGALVDVLDSNPCSNLLTKYNFSDANNEDLLNELNNNLKKNAANNSNLSNIEIVGFKFKPINSDYFNVTVDENNIVKVTQLQDVEDNEQVMFLAVNLVVRNITSGDISDYTFISFLADKNPHVPNVNKKLVNPLLRLPAVVCEPACAIIGVIITQEGIGACIAACLSSGFACVVCGLIWTAAVALGVYDCKQVCYNHV